MTPQAGESEPSDEMIAFVRDFRIALSANIGQSSRRDRRSHGHDGLGCQPA